MQFPIANVSQRAGMAGLGVFAACLAVGSLRADDWPQAQGIDRNNKSAETKLLAQWPAEGPELAWEISTIGLGYSGPAVVGERIYLMGARNGRAELFAVKTSDGSEIWKTTINVQPFDFKGNTWGIGPRGTPTVADGRVFALAADGQMICCNTEGQLKWSVNMVSDLGGAVKNVGAGEPSVFGWGFSWSPLVDQEKVICVPGGEKGMVAALSKETGKVLWRSTELTEETTYSSPIAATIEGVKQYIVMTQRGVAGVAASDGSLLWNYQRSKPYSDVVIPTPVVHDNHVYVSVGYGAGSDLIAVTKKASGEFSASGGAHSSRNSRNMKNTLGGFVLHEGFIYGCSERRGWICQDVSNGELKWYKKSGLGDGSVIFADGHLYAFSEREAEVALIEVSPEEWILKSKFTIPTPSKQRAPSGRAWTHPVIADGRLYIRDQELLYSYKVDDAGQ